MLTLTQNFDELKRQVAEHVAADEVIQGEYWTGTRGCFIGCLSHSEDPRDAVSKFGLTVPTLRIAEGIFEDLPIDEGRAFFEAFPAAVECDGKDLSRVHWQFLAAELRTLPEQKPEIQTVIDPVIEGMDLLAQGKPWSMAAYAAADAAAYAAYATDRAADAAYAARAAARAARAAADDTAYDARAAAYAAAYAAADAADAAAAATADHPKARRRQKDTLLRLIAQAPVVGEQR